MDVIKGWIGFDSVSGHVVHPAAGPSPSLDRILGRAMIGDGADVEVNIVDYMVVIKKTGTEIPLTTMIAAIFGFEAPTEPLEAILSADSGHMNIIQTDLVKNFLAPQRLGTIVEAGVRQVELYPLPENKGFLILAKDVPSQPDPAA